MRHSLLSKGLILALFTTTCAFAGISVSSPGNGLTLTSPVTFTAVATTGCQAGVAAVGIYTAPYQLAYVVNGASLNTSLPLNPGSYNIVVQSWDHCGQSATSSVAINVSNQAGVYVTSPANNSTSAPAVKFAATAITNCPQGVASMGIYPAPGQLAYVTNGASLNTTLQLAPGNYQAVVQQWDKCGGALTSPVNITVRGNTFTNLHSSGGWESYGQYAPKFIDCSPCGSDVTWTTTQGKNSPSKSGNATQYSLTGGTVKYADVLWNNHLIGDGSSKGLPDHAHALVPKLSTFVYDVYFYSSQISSSQALEFDINQFFNGMGFIWGHECRIAGGNEWDIWDNVNQHWAATGVACNPVNNAWNHLTIAVQRTSDNRLLYQSITLNGVTNTLNQYYDHGTAAGWYGITVNYQIDGNSAEDPYDTFLDDLNFSYD